MVATKFWYEIDWPVMVIEIWALFRPSFQDAEPKLDKKNSKWLKINRFSSYSRMTYRKISDKLKFI